MAQRIGIVNKSDGKKFFTMNEALIGGQNGFRSYEEGMEVAKMLYAMRIEGFCEGERNAAFKELDREFSRSSEPKFPLPPRGNKIKTRRVSGEASRQPA